jgi:hypothetical protein
MLYIETPWFNTISRYMLGIYAGFVLFWLSTTDIWQLDYVWSVIDLVFLTYFAAELAIRIFGVGIGYLFDCMNLFDAIIIIVSLFLYIFGIVSKPLAVLRLIRILLVSVVKFTGNQFQLRFRRGEDDPVKALEEMLRDLLKETAFKKSIKDQLNWAIRVIEQNKLQDMDSSKEKLDMYEETWLKVT